MNTNDCIMQNYYNWNKYCGSKFDSTVTSSLMSSSKCYQVTLHELTGCCSGSQQHASPLFFDQSINYIHQWLLYVPLSNSSTGFLWPAQICTPKRHLKPVQLSCRTRGCDQDMQVGLRNVIHQVTTDDLKRKDGNYGFDMVWLTLI